MSFPGSILLSDADARTTSVGQRARLGQRGYTIDRRAFRYSKNANTTLAVAKYIQAAAPDTSLDADQDLCTSTLYQDELTTATSVIYVKPAATEVIAAGVFNEGYLYINNELGEGQYLIIESNPYVDGTISVIWPIYLEPDSRLSATLSTASLIGLAQNKYKDVIIQPDTAAGSIAVGVTVAAVPASRHFWAQTWGPCVVLVNLTAAVGQPLSDDTLTGTGVAGDLHKYATSTDQLVGSGQQGRTVAYVINPVATGEHALIDLRLAP